MKNKPFAQRSVICRFVLFVIIVAAVLTARPGFALSLVDTLDITENSSTSLTVIFNSADVTASVVALNSPDNWTLTFDQSIQFGVFNAFWLEPDDPNFVNVVFNNGPNGSNVLFVLSENPNTGAAVSDGTPQIQNIVRDGQQRLVSITFHDLGDAAVGVPENASTLALFFLSLVALLGASRLRFGRFA